MVPFVDFVEMIMLKLGSLELDISLTLSWLLWHNLDKIGLRETSSCGGPIAAGAKTAAICRLLRRVFRPPLYMRSIAAFFVTAAIGRVFAASYSGGTKNRCNRPVLAAVTEL